jgi:hypothetical protein
MDLDFYRVLHLAGVIFLFTSIGGALLASREGATGAAARKLSGMTQGIALLIILVAGFGALAKLGLAMPGWAWAKLVIWLALGASPVLIRKRPDLAKVWWLVLPLLGVVAAALARYKPF